MDILRPGAVGTLQTTIVPPVTLAGESLESVSFDVVDEQGDLVQDSGAATITDAAAGTISLEIAIGANTLPLTATRGIRRCRITAIYVGGSTYETSLDYVIRGKEPLVIGENSFATYLEASLIAFEQAGLDGWEAAIEDQRISAMITARDALCRMSYKFDPFDSQNHLTDWPGFEGMHKPNLWTAAELASLPSDFLLALKKAQVYQADFILGGGSAEERARASGLMSKTVGESSEMYRPGMGPIEYHVCKRAMAALQGFTTNRQWSIGRG